MGLFTRVANFAPWYSCLRHEGFSYCAEKERGAILLWRSVPQRNSFAFRFAKWHKAAQDWYIG